MEALTRRGVDAGRVNAGVVAARQLAHGLVSGAEGDDGGEREQQGQDAINVPAAEDDAQVLGRPGEEHLVRSANGLPAAEMFKAYVHAAHVPVVHVWHVPVIRVVAVGHRSGKVGERCGMTVEGNVGLQCCTIDERWTWSGDGR